MRTYKEIRNSWLKFCEGVDWTSLRPEVDEAYRAENPLACFENAQDTWHENFLFLARGWAMKQLRRGGLTPVCERRIEAIFYKGGAFTHRDWV